MENDRSSIPFPAYSEAESRAGMASTPGSRTAAAPGAGGRSGRAFLLIVLTAISGSGCGQSRTSDTSRTATEQLLISDAVDRAVSDLDFSPLKGKPVYLDTDALEGAVDRGYLESTLRQHMLASEVVLREKKEDAQYVVEARTGALGTTRQDVLYGIPATNLPSLGPVGVSTTIPEVPFAKRTVQQGVAKLAVFAYDRESGRRIWQSGVSRVAANSKHLWVLGAGPFRSGTIYSGAGQIYCDRTLLDGRKEKLASDDLSVVMQQSFDADETGLADNQAPPAAQAPLAPVTGIAQTNSPAAAEVLQVAATSSPQGSSSNSQGVAPRTESLPHPVPYSPPRMVAERALEQHAIVPPPLLSSTAQWANATQPSQTSSTDPKLAIAGNRD